MKNVAMFLIVGLAALAVTPSIASAARERVTHVQDDSMSWYLTIFAESADQAAELEGVVDSDDLLHSIKSDTRYNVITRDQRRYQAFASQLDGHLPAVALQHPDGRVAYLVFGLDCRPGVVADELPLAYQPSGLRGNRRDSFSIPQRDSNPAYSQDKTTRAVSSPPPLVFDADTKPAAIDKEEAERLRPRPKPCPTPAPTPAPAPVTPVAPPREVRPKPVEEKGFPWGLAVVAGVLGLGGVIALKFMGEMRSGK